MPSCSTWSVLSGKDFVITWYHVKTDSGPGRPTQHPSWFVSTSSTHFDFVKSNSVTFFSCTLFYSENSVFVSNVLLFFVQWEEWSLLIWHQQRHSRMCRSFFFTNLLHCFHGPATFEQEGGAIPLLPVSYGRGSSLCVPAVANFNSYVSPVL